MTIESEYKRLCERWDAAEFPDEMSNVGSDAMHLLDQLMVERAELWTILTNYDASPTDRCVRARAILAKRESKPDEVHPGTAESGEALK